MDAYSAMLSARPPMTKLNKFLFFGGIIISIVGASIVFSGVILKHPNLHEGYILLVFSFLPLLISLYAKTPHKAVSAAARPPMTKLNRLLFYSGLVLSFASIVTVLVFTTIADGFFFIIGGLIPALMSIYAKGSRHSDKFSWWILAPYTIAFYLFLALFALVLFIDRFHPGVAADPGSAMLLGYAFLGLYATNALVGVMIVLALVVRTMRSSFKTNQANSSPGL